MINVSSIKSVKLCEEAIAKLQRQRDSFAASVRHYAELLLKYTNKKSLGLDDLDAIRSEIKVLAAEISSMQDSPEKLQKEETLFHLRHRSQAMDKRLVTTYVMAQIKWSKANGLLEYAEESIRLLQARKAQLLAG